MANRFNKPAGLKYTDMCIYIDANIHKIVNSGENPLIEERIYEYFYHILYALALKANYFSKNFDDYDGYAMYGAAELFMTLRRKQIDAGKEVRGKIVEPIKSCLNYIKHVMFPLKVGYERKNFGEVYNPEAGQDTSILMKTIRDNIQSEYRDSLRDDLEIVIDDFPKIISKVLSNTPYRSDKLMISKLTISCQLTFLNDIITTKKDSFASKRKRKKMTDDNLVKLYQQNKYQPILWHLPSHMSDYVRLLVTFIKEKLGEKLGDLRAATDLSEKVIDDILDSAYPNYDNRSEEI